jgi:hypothetical protein
LETMEVVLSWSNLCCGNPDRGSLMIFSVRGNPGRGLFMIYSVYGNLGRGSSRSILCREVHSWSILCVETLEEVLSWSILCVETLLVVERMNGLHAASTVTFWHLQNLYINPIGHSWAGVLSRHPSLPTEKSKWAKACMETRQNQHF